jgi:hypothetical protein
MWRKTFLKKYIFNNRKESSVPDTVPEILLTRVCIL